MAVILVIDDEPAMRDAVRVTLELARHKVLEARDGATAVEYYGSARPDLVITDVLMPAKDGLEVIREIRRLDPKARIIAMSGGGQFAELKYLAFTREFGALESLAKPFRAQQLLAAVERALSASP